MNQAITHYSDLPPRIQSASFVLGVLLMFELRDNRLPWRGRSGPGERRLLDAVRIDAGYCIDAPDELPAGGCASETADLGDGDPPVGFAVQLTVQRVQQEKQV